MWGTCTECGFEADCIKVENDLCPECDEDYETCSRCKTPCRTKDEQEKVFKRMGVLAK